MIHPIVPKNEIEFTTHWEDCIGKHVGNWTILSRCPVNSYNGSIVFNCRCKCGKEAKLLYSTLKAGKSYSCGCMRGILSAPYTTLDLLGKRFGKLTVIEKTDKRSKGSVIWKCRCDCGEICETLSNFLTHGSVKSCRKCAREKIIAAVKAANTKWKNADEHRIVHILNGMMFRCYNPRSKDYPNYGGKGVKICDEWRNSKQAFVDWSLSHGYKPGLTIDRLDSNGDYCPENCRWATILEQQSHLKTCRIIHLPNGTVCNAAECSRITGKPRTSLYRMSNEEIAKYTAQFL